MIFCSRNQDSVDNCRKVHQLILGMGFRQCKLLEIQIMAITVIILLLLKHFTGNVYALFVINLFLHFKNTVEPYGNVLSLKGNSLVPTIPTSYHPSQLYNTDTSVTGAHGLLTPSDVCIKKFICTVIFLSSLCMSPFLHRVP